MLKESGRLDTLQAYRIREKGERVWVKEWTLMTRGEGQSVLYD